jgi:hypothetical protein
MIGRTMSHDRIVEKLGVKRLRQDNQFSWFVTCSKRGRLGRVAESARKVGKPRIEYARRLSPTTRNHRALCVNLATSSQLPNGPSSGHGPSGLREATVRPCGS